MMEQHEARPEHHGKKHHESVNLSASNWIAIVSLVLIQVGSLIGVYVHMNTRLTVVETKLDVLTTERIRITDGLGNQMAEVRSELRDLRAGVATLQAAVARMAGQKQ